MAHRPTTSLRCFAFVLATTGTALAGGTSLDGRDDDHEHGPSIIGWARAVGSLAPLDNAKVTADAPAAAVSIVTRTDVEGRFRFAELGEDMPIDAIELACSHEGYVMVDIIRRRLSRDPAVPLEVLCVMARK